MAVWQRDAGLIVTLADGAGGVGAGAAAAQTIIDGAAAWTPASSDAGALLRDLDRRLAGSTAGQSTAVVLYLSASGLVGASVGDSGAWIIRDGSLDDITGAQNRKPLVGSGAAAPVAFGAGPLAGGTLLVASDGLLKFGKRTDIARIAALPDLASAALELMSLVTLRSGEVPDDVTVALCRELD